MRNSLEGIYIPAVTPVNEKEELDCGMLEYNIQRWNDTEVSGYMCLGSNGEFRMFDDTDSLHVIRTFCRFRGPGKGLIAGAGRESLYQTLKFIDRIQEEMLDIDYISVLTPHYFRKQMNDAALITYFTRVADFSRYPVVLYCAPGFANSVCISAEAVRVLAQHPNIHGLKDTSSDMMDAYMDVTAEFTDFSVVAGSFDVLHQCLLRGGKGGVLSAANYFPEECARLLKLWYTADEVQYLEQEEKLRERIRQTGGKRGVASVKYCMNLLGYRAGRPREPLLDMGEEEKEEILKNLDKENCI